MFVLIIRTVLLYFFVLFIIRLMGKRQLGQLQPFELVITVMVSELATLPMEDTQIPIAHAVITIIILLVLQVLTSFLQLKSEKIRLFLCGKPSIIIEHGNLNIKEMRNQKIDLNDLLEELRLKDIFNISDVEYAILETSGQLSILPKTYVTTVTKDDLDIEIKQEQLPVTLILDGVINHKNLKVLHKSLNWLNQLLLDNNITCAKDIFIAALDSRGEFYYQLKEGKINNNEK